MAGSLPRPISLPGTEHDRRDADLMADGLPEFAGLNRRAFGREELCLPARQITDAVALRVLMLVLAAADGQEAIERAAECQVDLVILDLYMPRIGGFGVLSALRARPEYSKIPIIALTARRLADSKARLTFHVCSEKSLERRQCSIGAIFSVISVKNRFV